MIFLCNRVCNKYYLNLHFLKWIIFHGPFHNCREKIGQVIMHLEPKGKLMGILRFPGTPMHEAPRNYLGSSPFNFQKVPSGCKMKWVENDVLLICIHKDVTLLVETHSGVPQKFTKFPLAHLHTDDVRRLLAVLCSVGRFPCGEQHEHTSPRNFLTKSGTILDVLHLKLISLCAAISQGEIDTPMDRLNTSTQMQASLQESEGMGLQIAEIMDFELMNITISKNMLKACPCLWLLNGTALGIMAFECFLDLQ